jgi:hypothetical protein
MGIKSNITLLSNASALGNGAAQTISIGGSYLYQIAGTFGGTTAKLQILGPDGTTYIDYPSVSHTAAGQIKIDLPAGATVRPVMTAGTPSAMYATLGLVQSAS